MNIRFLQNGAWLFSGKLVTQVIEITKLVVLGRLLTPVEFGIFSLIFLVTGALDMLTNTGLNAAMINASKTIDNYANQVLTVSILRGALLALATYLLSDHLALFFKEPRLTELFRLSSYAFLVQSLMNPYLVNFQKNVTFKGQFNYDTLTTILSAAITLILAFVLRNVTALVYANLAMWLIRVIMSYILTEDYARPSFKLHSLAELFGFSKWIFVQILLLFFWQQTDRMIIGRLLSMEALGQYQIASRIALLPVVQISLVSTTFLFPIYSKMSKALLDLSHLYMVVNRLIIYMCLPITLFLAINGKLLIFSILGDNWVLATEIIHVLCAYSFIKVLGDISTSLYLGLGRPNVEAYRNAMQLIILVILIYSFYEKFSIGILSYILCVASLPSLYLWLRSFGRMRIDYFDLMRCLKVVIIPCLLVVLVPAFFSALNLDNSGVENLIYIGLTSILMYVLYTIYIYRYNLYGAKDAINVLKSLVV